MKKSAASGPIRVAVVEDNPRIRSSLGSILSQDPGVECVGLFSGGEEALMALPGLHPKVVLMDINLPGIDGVECVRRITSIMAGVQIVMLTVHRDTEAIYNSLAAGASGYLLKPLRAAALLEAVRDVSTGGAPMTSFIARKVVQSFKQAGHSPRDTDNLAPREVEVLELLVKGFAYKEIATELAISYSTVQTYIQRIYDKLHVQSRSHAVAKYLGA